MAGNILSIANVITISVATPQGGLGQFNTSNLAIFSSEEYDAGTFGDDGYKIYFSPTEVAEDFGTDSRTYKAANAVFSQQPNILLGGGYLVIFPQITAIQTLALSGVPASGSFTLAFTQGTTAAIQWNDLAAAIQTKIRAVSGLESVVVSGSLASQTVTLKMFGVSGPEGLPTVGGSGLMTSAPAAITITPATATAGEDFNTAIIRTGSVVEYFGMCSVDDLSDADVLEAAATVQALQKILFIVSNEEGSIDTSGLIDDIRTGSFTHTRGLYYGDEEFSAAIVYMGSYAGLGLSTNFGGSNTTQTMNLKTMSGVQPDPTMTQTIRNKAKAAGADIYASIQGVPKVLSSGANDFYDNVYNLTAFVGYLNVAEFNSLAQTNTKVPQTESGMNVLKGAARNVCEQFRSNGFIAPGTWTNPTTFGNQDDFYQNILQRGYYIYSSPISQQAPASREAREAPLVQIAIKYAGAIHSMDGIIYVNP